MLIAVSSFGESPRRDLLTALAGAVFNSIQTYFNPSSISCSKVSKGYAPTSG
jgi:hypothetical protein